MTATLNLTLTDELRLFVAQNSGDGMLFPTPAEFIVSILREEMERREAGRIRDAIIEGYADAICGRTVPYNGDLRQCLEDHLTN